jgi:hypothetical protein
MMSDPVHPEDDLEETDPNPEGEDVHPDLVPEQDTVRDADTEWDEEGEGLA